MPLGRAHEPFSHPEWLYEVKHDGFRALLYSGAEGVRLVSRNGNTFKSFSGLCDGLQRDPKGQTGAATASARRCSGIQAR
jgi:ATP-dependent DNA ligase